MISDDQKSFDGDFSNTMSNPMGALTDKQKREEIVPLDVEIGEAALLALSR
jgi:hypothetical protein